MACSSSARLLPLFIFALFLGACNAGNGEDELLAPFRREEASAAEPYWRLLQGTLAGKAFSSDDANVTLVFDDNHLYGYSGVNRYRAPVSVKGHHIVLNGPIITTRMAGPLAAMRLESDYLSALRKITRYRRDGERLQMRGDDGVVLSFGAATNSAKAIDTTQPL